MRQGSCSLPSNEKPTVMVTKCPAIAFTLRVSGNARHLNNIGTQNILRETSTRASKTCVKIFLAEYSCSRSVADRNSTFWPLSTKNPHANFNDLESSVPPEESNDELLYQAWDGHTA